MRSTTIPTDKKSGRAVQSLAERVYLQIREEIASCEFLPDTMLDEAYLAKRYRVSRTPIREALRRLEQDGLVLTIPRRGTFVRRPTFKDLIEIDQIRRLLEPAAARMACGKVNAEELARIDAQISEMQNSKAGDINAFLAMDSHLHELILHSSGNGLLRDVVTALHDRTRAVQRLSTVERIRESLGELKAVVRALQAGDGVMAENAMLEHLKAAMHHKLYPYRVNTATEERLRGDLDFYLT